MENLKNNQRRIIFFDGECHLCNGFVDALISRDLHHKLSFAPLQGETAKDLLSLQDRQDLNTIIYFESGKAYYRSDAVLRALCQLGRGYKLFRIFTLLPRFIRDSVYKWVAKNRYSWFGKEDVCRIPLPEERQYLLP